MDKPKEFWIFPQKGNDCEWTNLYPDASWRSETKPLIHVIEYSAHEQLQKRFEEAVEVLEWYAKRDALFDDRASPAKSFLQKLECRTIQETKGE